MKRFAILAIILAAGILVASLAVHSCFHHLSEAPGEMIDGVSRAGAASVHKAANVFVELLNLRPEIRISEKVIQEQSCPIAEFAVMKKQYLHRYVWKHRWLGSEKIITIEGLFEAKAGFDLKERFVVRLDPQTGVVIADLPPVRILSIEQTGQLTFQDEDGLWNRVQPADRQQALNEFERTAREKVVNSGLLDEAGREALRRLQELADRNRSEMMFYFRK